MVTMHEWAAVNGWCKPEIKSGYGRFSVNVPIRTPMPERCRIRTPHSKYSWSPSLITPLPPRSGLRRCHTTLLGQATFVEKQQVYKPKKQYIDSSTTKYIKYLESSNKDCEARIKNGNTMLSVERSRSDLESRDSGNPISIHSVNVPPTLAGSLKERSPYFMNGGSGSGSSQSDHGRREGTFVHPGAASSNKQELKIGVAMVPKKGLISLSTNDHQQPQMYIQNGHDLRRQQTTLSEHSSSGGKQRPKTLIKRHEILGHIKAGTKLLEDAEEQRKQEEEMSKSLGDYTIVDLQSKILEMTDAKSLRRSGRQSEAVSSDPVTEKTVDKSFALPAIKTFNPSFALKS